MPEAETSDQIDDEYLTLRTDFVLVEELRELHKRLHPEDSEEDEEATNEMLEVLADQLSETVITKLLHKGVIPPGFTWHTMYLFVIKMRKPGMPASFLALERYLRQRIREIIEDELEIPSQ